MLFSSLAMEWWVDGWLVGCLGLRGRGTLS